jgi:L-galactose dehydrogenase
LARLRVDHVDVLILHDVEYAKDLDQVAGEAYDAVQELKRAGRVHFVGLSGYPLSVLREVVDRAEVAHPNDPFDVVLSYCHGNLNDTTLVEALPYFSKQAVIHAAPLSQGLLTPGGIRLRGEHAAPDRLRQACSQASAHCAVKGASIVALAMRYSTTLDVRIATTVVSCSSPAEVEAVVEAVTTDTEDDDLLEEVLAILAPVHNVTW